MAEDDKETVLFSRVRLNVVSQILVISLIATMIAAPVGVLYLVQLTKASRLIVVCMFIAAFPVLMWIFARLNSHELVAGTAA